MTWVKHTLAATAAALCLAAEPEPCLSGHELFASRDFARAQERLWQCIDQGASSKESAYELVHTYRELKNYSAGLERLRATPATLDRLYVKAFLLFRSGAYRQSIDLLGEAYRLDRADWRVHQLFGLNYVVLEIPEGAGQEFEEAVKLNPANAELWYHLARFFYSQSRVTDSLAASQRALLLSPGYPDAHGNIALCYEALSRPDLAKEHYQKAIELNRKLDRRDEWPLLNYAAFLIKEQQLEASLGVAGAALELNPQSARAHYLRGKALRKMERLPEAKTAFEQSISLDPREPGAYYEMGALLRRLGDMAGSQKMYSRFEELSKKPERAGASGPL